MAPFQDLERGVKNALATSPAKRAGGATALELRARLNSVEHPRMPPVKKVRPPCFRAHIRDSGGAAAAK